MQGYVSLSFINILNYEPHLETHKITLFMYILKIYYKKESMKHVHSESNMIIRQEFPQMFL